MRDCKNCGKPLELTPMGLRDFALIPARKSIGALIFLKRAVCEFVEMVFK